MSVRRGVVFLFDVDDTLPMILEEFLRLRRLAIRKLSGSTPWPM